MTKREVQSLVQAGGGRRHQLMPGTCHIVSLSICQSAGYGTVLLNNERFKNKLWRYIIHMVMPRSLVLLFVIGSTLLVLGSTLLVVGSTLLVVGSTLLVVGSTLLAVAPWYCQI
jgi:hypothetical protein